MASRPCSSAWSPVSPVVQPLSGCSVKCFYGMSPFDWSVFSTVVVVLAITAALACIIPAWRASRLDPAKTLRAE
jgi:hypothetical protein